MRTIKVLVVLALVMVPAVASTPTPTMTPTATNTATPTSSGVKLISPDIGITPTPNVRAGAYNWTNGIRSVWINNTTSQTVCVKFNGPATATEYDLILANNGSINVLADDIGLQRITSIHVWFPSSSTPTNLVMRGR